MEVEPLLGLQTPQEKAKPKDAFRFVYITHLMLGCSTFLLWKVFITPYDYFTAIYSGFHFEFWFASFYWTPGKILTIISDQAIPCLILMATHGTRIPLKPRIYSSVIVFFAIMASIPFINKYILQENISLWLTLALVIVGGIIFTTCNIAGTFSAVFFASSFGLAAMFPPIYTQAIMTGNAIAGTILKQRFTHLRYRNSKYPNCNKGCFQNRR